MELKRKKSIHMKYWPDLNNQLNLWIDETMIISKADKGNAVVIQNKKDYMQKALDILLVSGKFAEVKDTSKKKLADYDPAYETIKRENKLQKLLRTLKSNGEIDNNVYKRVFPSGSRAGIMYTTPKIHKIECLHDPSSRKLEHTTIS